MYESVISSGVTMNGDLISSGDVKVKGNFEGDIECRNLVIEFGSEVKGTVKAERIIVKGQITGSVNGVRVVLSATAKVYGDMNSTSLFIDEEALFEGSSQRVENPLGLDDKSKKGSSDSFSKSEAGKSDKESGAKIYPLAASSSTDN